MKVIKQEFFKDMVYLIMLMWKMSRDVPDFLN